MPAHSTVIARAVRGMGLPSLEARADRWFAKLTEGDAETLLDELHGRTDRPLDPIH